MSSSPTVDQLGRPLRDLRISLTDQCNMRCRYCMPAEIFGAHYQFLSAEKQLSFEEIVRIAKVAEHFGVQKIRLTGGEPLMRKNTAELVAMLSGQTKIRDIALTTNGLLLPKQADALKRAGLSRVNLSFDALDQQIFSQMSGGYGKVERVKRAVDVCQEFGIPLKINTVLKKSVNESQILPMIAFGESNDIEVRFIEYMDVGCSNSWEKHDVVTESSILETVASQYGEIEAIPADATAVARNFRIASNQYEFGIISSISRPFCGGCVRGRISSDGKLYTCLFSDVGYDLRDFLRSGATDQQLFEKLAQLWEQRSDRYSEQREELEGGTKRIEMSYIGG